MLIYPGRIIGLATRFPLNIKIRDLIGCSGGLLMARSLDGANFSLAPRNSQGMAEQILVSSDERSVIAALPTGYTYKVDEFDPRNSSRTVHVNLSSESDPNK